MIKVTLGEVWESRNSIDYLLSLKMPIKEAYRLAKNLKEVAAEVEHIEERRIELVRKYGEAQDDGRVAVTRENLNDFNLEVSELMAVEIEFDFEPLELETLENNSSSVDKLLPILWLFND